MPKATETLPRVTLSYLRNIVRNGLYKKINSLYLISLEFCAISLWVTVTDKEGRDQK